MEEATGLPEEKFKMACEVLPDKEVVFPSTSEDKEIKPFCQACIRPFTHDEMKGNRKLDSFLLKKVQNQEVKLECGLCVMDDPVASFCVECNLFLCDPCIGYHSRKRGKQDHHLDRDLETRKLVEIEMNKVNRDQWESDDAAAISICNGCQKKLDKTSCRTTHDIGVSNHADVHINKKIEVTATQNKNNENETIRKTNIPSNILSKVREDIGLVFPKLKEKMSSVEKQDCDAFFQEFPFGGIIFQLLDMIQKHEKSIICEEQQQQKQKVEITLNKIKLLEHVKQDCTSMLQVLQDVYKHLGPIAVMNVARTVLPRLETLNKIAQKLQGDLEILFEKDASANRNDEMLPDFKKITQRLGLLELASVPRNSAERMTQNQGGTQTQSNIANHNDIVTRSKSSSSINLSNQSTHSKEVGNGGHKKKQRMSSRSVNPNNRTVPQSPKSGKKGWRDSPSGKGKGRRFNCVSSEENEAHPELDGMSNVQSAVNKDSGSGRKWKVDNVAGGCGAQNDISA